MEQEQEVIRRKVWKNKSNGQKLVTIPKDCSIEDGDEVIIKKDKKVTWN